MKSSLHDCFLPLPPPPPLVGGEGEISRLLPLIEGMEGEFLCPLPLLE
ncbi:hypothetical protein A2U01_0077953, partial [Trifolium medium]|nr:hypothetical protein [Trifolium medium]